MLNKVLKLRGSLVHLRLPNVLNPIESIRQLILWFSVYGGVSFIMGNLIVWFRGAYASATWDTITATTLFGVILGAAVEEGLFRWLAKRVMGNFGLLVGTIVWILWHPFNTSPPLWHRIPTDTLLGIFYIKLWRGKWRWMSFAIHPLWNITVILLWQFLKS